MPSLPPAWYVVHARPKCEHLAAALMRELPGVESYCPRIRFQRSTRRGKVWFVEALFPGYLFVRFDPELSLRAVRHAQHVIRVVEFGGRLCAVPDAVIDLQCSKGTYVRTFAADLGEDLGCGAHLLMLRRTSTGAFDIADAVSLPTLETMEDDARLSQLLPIDALLGGIARLDVGTTEAAALAHELA